MDTPELSACALDALFDQSPAAVIFVDVELRAQRANAAFRRLTGLSEEELVGHRPSETPRSGRVSDTGRIERILAEQVIDAGVPVVNMPIEYTAEGRRWVFAWTAYRVTIRGRVIGAVASLTDVTQAAQARADLDLLERAGSRIGTTLDVHRTAAELAVLAVPEVADGVAVDLLDAVQLEEDPASAGNRELRFHRFAVVDATAACTGSAKVDEMYTVPISCQPAGVFLRGELLVARDRDELSRLGLPAHIVQPLLNQGVHTLIMAPLTARGVTLGVATFSRVRNRESYGEADERLVRDLAARAAVHIDNARLYTREHEAAVTLQRSLLPRDIPSVPGLEIAHRYRPASRAAEIGGDWFDVVALEDGRVTLMVGDVTGHGIRASAIMGQLRTTAAALTRLGCPPDEILRQLGPVVAAHGDEAGATCLQAVYDPASRRCRLTSAGHLPPALRHPDGATEFIDVRVGPPLGAGDDQHPAVERQLPPGSILALYTDGLIEEPGQDIAGGMSRLARALGDGPTGSLEELCDSVLATLAPRMRDDVALLLARTTTTP
ncbi:MAG TPA: SpoIIE family protein phosphatase [Trebonia sp.]|nr:SpoIIE family protein phosphatase [Trebonia sp.]